MVISCPGTVLDVVKPVMVIESAYFDVNVRSGTTQWWALAVANDSFFTVCFVAWAAWVISLLTPGAYSLNSRSEQAFLFHENCPQTSCLFQLNLPGVETLNDRWCLNIL